MFSSHAPSLVFVNSSLPPILDSLLCSEFAASGGWGGLVVGVEVDYKGRACVDCVKCGSRKMEK